jgi:hypothetical protein
MRHQFLILTLLVIIFPHTVMTQWRSSPLLQTNIAPSASIDAPVPGQAVQGSVIIHGNTGTEVFQSYEVDFSYVDDPTQTWFLIQESTTPIQNGVLAVWDTTTITDGEYTLRLLISLADGSQMEVVVNDLRVRNYTPIETDTPTPTQPTQIQVPGTLAATVTPKVTSTYTLTPLPLTPTPLPTNPAVISSSQMLLTLGKGVLLTIGIFAILGAYLGIRTALRNRK